MTKEQARNLKQGDKVFIYGNKTKAQLITWCGHNIFGQRTDAVRFATGDFFNTDLGYDEIEFAPSNSIVEMPSDETTEVLIRNGFSCDFYKIDVPLDNRRNKRSQFFTDNKIEQERGGLVTYNYELIKTLKRA